MKKMFVSLMTLTMMFFMFLLTPVDVFASLEEPTIGAEFLTKNVCLYHQHCPNPLYQKDNLYYIFFDEHGTGYYQEIARDVQSVTKTFHRIDDRPFTSTYGTFVSFTKDDDDDEFIIIPCGEEDFSLLKYSEATHVSIQWYIGGEEITVKRNEILMWDDGTVLERYIADTTVHSEYLNSLNDEERSELYHLTKEKMSYPSKRSISEMIDKMNKTINHGSNSK